MSILVIDGGGTYTRVACANEKGEIVHYIKVKCTLNYVKNHEYEEDATKIITNFFDEANIAPKEIKYALCGISGINFDKDYQRYKSLFNSIFIYSKVDVVNDSIIALYGAFNTTDGIVVIQGSGYNIVSSVNKIIKTNHDLGIEQKISSRHFAYRIENDFGLSDTYPVSLEQDPNQIAYWSDRVLKLINHPNYMNAVQYISSQVAKGIIKHLKRFNNSPKIRLFGGMYKNPEFLKKTIESIQLQDSNCDIEYVESEPIFDCIKFLLNKSL
jgi:N-acetylglucosamine kinase-like BadF-type ATPase